ncbi:Dirigent protein 21 [Camellia lanceoleosa]|uniref:Dirigent protein 21 n=1 Tax=Camellia lanceoleosa TaxID=1840588 RepID=A0ACC0IMT5_9ERIC|nr:Dirigent protein 21 [Camellia lanceoleosa]
MGKQLCAILILCSMVISITAVHGIAEDPISVEKWFDNLTNSKQKVTKLEFYFQDMRGGKNPTSIQVARGNHQYLTHSLRGINMVDNPLTVGPELSSKQLGRAQGIYGASSMEEMSLLTLVNLAFTDGKYNGSTLALLGRNPILEEYREMSIVGGSGLFRLARGIATAKTYSINATSGYGVVHYHVIAIHY